MPIPGWVASMGQESANNAAQGILGLAFGAAQNKRQVKQQRRLTGIQTAAQKELAKFQQQQQMEMWEATGYGAQSDQMKRAGLNPGLMYGMGGGGAQTVGSASGSVGAGTASGAESGVPQSTGMGMQLQLLKAQKENIEADTQQKLADAHKTAGVDTEETKGKIASLAQGVENAKAQEALTKAQEALTKLQTDTQAQTQEATVHQARSAARIAMQQLEIAENEAYMSTETRNDKIKQIRAEAIGAGIKNLLMKAQRDQTKQLTAQSKAQIDKWAIEVAQAQEGLDIKTFEAKLQQMVEQWKMEHPGMDAVKGGLINEIIEGVRKIVK